MSHHEESFKEPFAQMAETSNGRTSFSYSHAWPPLNPSPYIVSYGSSPMNLNAMNRNVSNMVPTNNSMPDMSGLKFIGNLISPVVGANVNHGTHLNLQNPAYRDSFMSKEMNQFQTNWPFEWMKNASLGHQKAPGTGTSRAIWNAELRRKFFTAIDQLGLDNCTPTKIHELLNVPGLSRERVASHLKRHRKMLRTMKEETQQSLLPKKDDGLRSLKSEPEPSLAKKSTNQFLQKARVGSSATRTAVSPLIDNSQRNSQPLMIGTTSARPRPSVQENKGEPNAKVIHQPSWFSSGESSASQTNQLREALSKTTPYGNVTVPKVESYGDFSCMGSNIGLNQYQKGDNGFQLSTNEALLGISKTLMNRSTGLQFSTNEASMGITPMSLHTEASMGRTPRGMNFEASGVINSSYAPGNHMNTLKAPVSITITNPTQNFPAYGNREMTPFGNGLSTANLDFVSSRFASATSWNSPLPDSSMNFEASRGINSSYAPGNHMNTLKAPVNITITNPTQNFPAYGNREMTPYGGGLSTANLDFVSSRFASATSWNSPLPDSSNNWSLINIATTHGDIFSQNFDISGVQMPIISPQWCNDPDPFELVYNQGREYGHQNSNGFTENQLNDAFSVTGDSPFSTLEHSLLETPIITGRRRDADLFELAYNQGREYGRQNSDSFTGSNPNDDFAVIGETPFDTREHSQLETPIGAGRRRDADLFELVYSRGQDAINEDPDEAMDGVCYLLDSPENSSSETGMSGRRAAGP